MQTTRCSFDHVTVCGISCPTWKGFRYVLDTDTLGSQRTQMGEAVLNWTHVYTQHLAVAVGKLEYAAEIHKSRTIRKTQTVQVLSSHKPISFV